MGIEIPDFDNPNIGADDDDDESLEAELMAMQQGAGGPASRKSKANQKKPGSFFSADFLQKTPVLIRILK